ncbi:hypothetical protein ACIA3K_29800 [Micromonospora sp. NPDC051543]|uniref:hypothetical protein n=1 Tax=Micromonospora sp. NPDC051543 TaxID=3364287 RepID=UPI00378FC01F
MSIGEVKAALDEARHLLDQGRTTIESIGTSLDEAAGTMLPTLHDSRREEAEKARKAVSEALREVTLTLRVITSAQESADEFRGALG